MDQLLYLGVGIDDTTTGLTHIGAREYDQKTGRFLSADPIIDFADPLQMNGYAYSNNSPVTRSDPTGLKSDECGSLYACGGNQVITSNTTQYENVVTVARHYDLTASWKTHYDWKWEGSRSHGKAAELTKYVNPDYEHNWGWNAVAGAGRWFLDSATFAAGPVGSLIAGASYDYAVTSLGVDTNGRSYQATQDGLNAFSMVTPLGALTAAGSGLKIAAAVAKGCSKCFLAGTDVLMSDKSTKDIEDIKLGDEVMAADPKTGESGPRRVTRLIVTEDDKHFNELTIDTEVGPKKPTATHEHPFWSPSESNWIEADRLTAGMTLLTDENDTVTVLGNRAYTQHARTYNLTVDDLHTYYVLAGETPVLVHNSNCPIGSVIGPKGEDLPLPKGAVGTPVETGKGMAYSIPAGTKGLDSRVTQVILFGGS